MDSAASPDNARSPASTWVCVAASTVSSARVGASPDRLNSSYSAAAAAMARSIPPSTIQVSLDIWSRTARAARPSRSTDCASEPDRSLSTVRDHSWVPRSSAAVSVPVMSPNAFNSTGTHSLASMNCRYRYSWKRSRVTDSSLTRFSARSP
ncbi:Uncharacterised protein [Mycobacteroides abscessus subsp. abscessus]|nr:Uncharacterised protein [Mycobacteroides abscessus subsp. abscessus]